VRPILVDTGVIVSSLVQTEKHHGICVQALRDAERPLLTCDAVIVESCHILRRVAGAAEAVLANISAGLIQTPFQLSRQSAAVRSILKKYRDLRIDFADACLIRMAEQFETGEILTLDQDFDVYRWGKNKPFRISP
jgi:uncharacterized protein